MGTALILVYLAIVVFMIASVWKVFTKAGKPGWAILIPIYNILIMLEIAGKPWWWLLLIMFVPFANIILAIWMVNLIALGFGKTSGFTVGLLLLPIIFWPILGFGSAKYKGPAGK